MQLFYAPDITLEPYTLSEEESKHCIKVLRLHSGDTIQSPTESVTSTPVAS